MVFNLVDYQACDIVFYLKIPHRVVHVSNKTMEIIYPKNETEFRQLVETRSCVVVDLYSTDCPPCSRLSPIFDRAVQQYPSVTFLKLNRQEFRELAESLYIFSSPTVLFFHKGVLQDNRLAGIIEEADLQAEIEQLLLKKDGS